MPSPITSPRFAARFALVAVFSAALSAGVAACTSSNGGGGGGGSGGGGQGGGGGEPVQTACDPLAPPPITLGAIIGVGKDAPGFLYVDAQNGIFVSNGDTLHRQHVTGTGEKGTTEFLFTLEAPSDAGASTKNLLVETDGHTATAMALGPADSKAFLDESPAGITMLTLVPASSVDGMKVENTPNVIQYVGDVANGDVIMATVPMNLDSTATGGLAIFYGPKGAVAQRKIVDFQQTLSNSGTLTFLVGGTQYTLEFGTVAGPDAGPLGEFALLGLTPAGGATMSVSIRKPTPTALPEGLSFTCIK